MACIPSKRILLNNTVFKSFLRGSVFPSERYYCSKDTADINNTKSDLKDNGDTKKDEKTSPNEKLCSNETEVTVEQKKAAAKKKLFSLLSELKVSPDQSKVRPDLVLSKPLKRITKKERFADELKAKRTPVDEINLAVSAVAKSMGGDPLETKTELEQKLSSLDLISKDSFVDKSFLPEDLGIGEKIQEELMSSVKDVASSVPTPLRSKLTERLLKLSVEKKDKQTKISMENTLKGLKVEKNQVKVSKPATPAIKLKERNIPARPKERVKINIFLAPPLDIFTLESKDKEALEQTETVWERLEKKKLKLLTEYAPANAFEEMIRWTEQGKHWKFPIDNETEMGEEESVGFHEHVFLEQHLHGFPDRGPIRHFMELVAVGLSKNPYITVERKIENINWFRDYFKEKKELLKEVGALG